MSDDSPQRGYLRQAWLVILLALFYGGALAGVQVGLGPRIAENKRQETYRVIPELVPGADQTKTVEHVVVGEDGKEQRVYQAISSAGVPVGWVIPASGQGFADRIDVLVGTDARLETITGIYVLDQKETPALGNLIVEPDFRQQFAEKRTDLPLVVVKGDPSPGSNQIRALSGATISSESVATIVNDSTANLKGPIRELPVLPPDQSLPASETQ
jgi:Na+-translocating ferredoxin:NAD+ oxidoreductase subunit G